jgi:hypothetical protein
MHSFPERELLIGRSACCAAPVLARDAEEVGVSTAFAQRCEAMASFFALSVGRGLRRGGEWADGRSDAVSFS